MRPAFIATILIVPALFGCSSDDDPEPRPITDDTVELSEYGVIRVAHEVLTAQTQVDAVFCALSNPARAVSIDNQFLTATDSCVVSNEEDAETNAVEALVCADSLPAQTISAGNNLLLSSSAGTYADLSKQEMDESITYTASTPLPRPPDGLTIDIPGDTFPQFSDVEIPDLEDLNISSPGDGEALTSDTSIRWTAASVRENSRVLLSASDAGVTVTCSLADDGRFAFSTATQAQMGELFSAAEFSVRRQNFVSPTRGDSGLVIITSIE